MGFTSENKPEKQITMGILAHVDAGKTTLSESILYLTGYLTRVREIPASDGALALTIPNAEVQEIFRSTIQKWFKDSSQTWNRQARSMTGKYL